METDRNLDNLVMKVSPSARRNYLLRQAIAHILNWVPGARPVIRVSQKALTHLQNIDNAFQQTRVLSGRITTGAVPGNDALSFDSGFGYASEFSELSFAEHYRQQLVEGDWNNQKTESHDLYAAIIPLLHKYIEQQSIRDVLDFGVAYGYVDSQLAERLGSVQFTAIDRSPLTKFYNERFFQLPNLSFIAGNVFDYIDSRTWSDALCFHMRTLGCLPETFAKEFYAKCAKAGFRYIVGAEPCGLSWQTSKPYRFSFECQPSVVFRNGMFIHNYPELLKKAGYDWREASLLKTSHPDPNYRLLLFVAERAI